MIVAEEEIPDLKAWIVKKLEHMCVRGVESSEKLFHLEFSSNLFLVPTQTRTCSRTTSLP